MLYWEANKYPENQLSLRKRFNRNSMLYLTALWREVKNKGPVLWLKKQEQFGEWHSFICRHIIWDLEFFYDQFQKSVSRRAVVANPVCLFPVRLSPYSLPLTITKRAVTGVLTSSWIPSWPLALCSTKSANSHAGRTSGRGKAVFACREQGLTSHMSVPATNLEPDSIAQ